MLIREFEHSGLARKRVVPTLRSWFVRPRRFVGVVEISRRMQGIVALVVPSGERVRLAPTSTRHRLVSQGEPQIREVSARRFSSSGNSEKRTYS